MTATATCPATRRLAEVLAQHLDPDRGTPYWLDRQQTLGFDIRREVRELADLARLGPFETHQLRERPLTDFVPRAQAGDLDLIVVETGATTGRPCRAVFSPAEFGAAFGDPFVAVARAAGFPRGGQWLFAGPSGPHPIARAAQLLARAQGARMPFAVDLDPRWARAQRAGSAGALIYREHVLGQALDVLGREPIDVLFATPPLALALGDALDAPGRRPIRGIHLGGLPIDGPGLARLRRAFEQAVILPGYGNSLFGLMMPPAEPFTLPDGSLQLDYAPLADGRLLARVVADGPAGPDLARPLAAGETGRVVLSRLDASCLIVNLVERDAATVVEIPAAGQRLGLAALGLRNPHPAAAAQAPSEGLY